MKLSKDFYTKELCISKDFPQLALAIIPTEIQIQRAELLAQSCAQPLRDAFGKLIVISWLRSDALNTMIHKGKITQSDHLLGNAVDVFSYKYPAEELFQYVVGTCLPYRQIIWYPERYFIHISCNIPGRVVKHSALICKRGKYKRLDRETEREFKLWELYGA